MSNRKNSRVSFHRTLRLLAEILKNFSLQTLPNGKSKLLEKFSPLKNPKATSKRCGLVVACNTKKFAWYPSGEDEVLFIVRDNSDRKRAELALRLAKQQSERLLLNILPRSIAERLKQTTGAIAEQYESVSILFADIVGFTPLSAQMSPIELVELLNQIFSEFDKLADKHGLEKIKTIGDAYMVVGGLPERKPGHLEAIAAMALDMQAAMPQFQTPKLAQLRGENSLKIRIGISTGSVVAGVIGMKKFIYDLWGDTVNVASRMEAQGEPGKIQVTANARDTLRDLYHFSEQRKISVKGKGDMITYWLLGKNEG
jgi:class 3 adenylate cyclase